MRVLVLDTGRGIDAAKVALWRSQLGLDETDEVSLLSWFPPRPDLPVSSALVCGPELHVGREPQEWPVADPEELEEVLAAVPPVDPPEAGHTDGRDPGNEDDGSEAFELDEQLTEHEADPAQAAAADRVPLADGTDGDEDPEDGLDLAPGLEPHGTTSAASSAAPTVLATNLSHLPVYHPRRMRQAVRWRRKWAQRRASRFTSRQVRRVRATASGARHLPTTVVRSALRTRKDAISWEFALATSRSHKVTEVFRAADVVVPVDQRSHKAAWLLARRHPGPDVVVTLQAAARSVAERRRG